MKEYKRISKVTNIKDIPLNQNIIVSGNIGKGWFLRVPCKILIENNILTMIDNNGARGDMEINKDLILDFSILEKTV